MKVYGEKNFPTKEELAEGSSNKQPPTSEFILRRILHNDMAHLHGWLLNNEMRRKFTDMLREVEQKLQR